MKNAVVAFVFASQGTEGDMEQRLLDSEVVVVPRRGSNLYTLPGGKEEPQDRSLYEAIVRELKEECGVEAVPGGFSIVYAAPVGVKGSDTPYMVYTLISMVHTIPEVMCGDTGTPTTMTIRDLLAQESPFERYNKNAFENLKHFFWAHTEGDWRLTVAKLEDRSTSVEFGLD